VEIVIQGGENLMRTIFEKIIGMDTNVFSLIILDMSLLQHGNNAIDWLKFELISFFNYDQRALNLLLVLNFKKFYKEEIIVLHH